MRLRAGGESSSLIHARASTLTSRPRQVPRQRPVQKFQIETVCTVVVLLIILIYFAGYFILLSPHGDGLGTITDRSSGLLVEPHATSRAKSSSEPPSPPKTRLQWEAHAGLVTRLLQNDVTRVNRKPVTAFLEPPLQASSQGPLPLRTLSPDQLEKVVYPRVYSCQDMPAKFPVDRGPDFDAKGNLLVTNVGDQNRSSSYWNDQTRFCPVDADPFLPWIHDVFLRDDKVFFVAQNKRRCQTGSNHQQDKDRLEPQVALLQSVPIQRLSNEEAHKLAPNLWYSNSNATRYRLSSYEEADPDSKYTRFICRFHTIDPQSDSGHQRIELGETLSQYPFSYELAAYRKHNNNKEGLLSKHGNDNTKFWTATLLFECPLPAGLPPRDIPWTVQDSHGEALPLIHVDLIPIRTLPRTPMHQEDGSGGFYLSSEQIGPDGPAGLSFRPEEAWGDRHVLPLLEASGRWENIPVCPLVDAGPVSRTHTTDSVSETTNPYLLAACLWAAASFRTRGKEDAKISIDDTKERLREWIEFHLLVGFDHIYVYDNSGAFGNATNLKDIVNLFPSTQVSWIDWPSQICNNNIPAHDNTGERSSQYAAENSCRARYGPRTEWMASFDTDEYLVPQGKHDSLRSVVEEAKHTKILSFMSSRGKLRYDFSMNAGKGRIKLGNTTFLQAFNCDSSPTPRPSWAERARKQLYRTDYVLNHFVHYSTVTKSLVTTYQEAEHAGQPWNRFFSESEPNERFVDEVNEAIMIHAKSLDLGQTTNTENRCRFDFSRRRLGCFVGFPWPDNQQSEIKTYNATTGFMYNCFVNQRVDEHWIPRLEEAMRKRLQS